MLKLKKAVWWLFLLTSILFILLIGAALFPPATILSCRSLNLAAEVGGLKTSPQKITIDFKNPLTGAKKRERWEAKTSHKWLRVRPERGQGQKIIYTSLWSSGLNPGRYQDRILFIDPETKRKLGEVKLSLRLLPRGTSQPPFGHIDWPEEGVRVSRRGFFATGWALDDIEVTTLEIKGEVMSKGLGPKEGESANNESRAVLIIQAGFFEGTRPDVARAFPDFPFNQRAGWGTFVAPPQFLKQGDRLRIRFLAQDKEGHRVELGARTVILQ